MGCKRLERLFSVKVKYQYRLYIFLESNFIDVIDVLLVIITVILFESL